MPLHVYFAVSRVVTLQYCTMMYVVYYLLYTYFLDPDWSQMYPYYHHPYLSSPPPA